MAGPGWSENSDMAKKFRNMRCVYCLRDFEVLTSDHVFPKAWYPSSSPDDNEKWQVPACQECNQNYSRIEGHLLQRIGLCVDPNSSESLGIPERVLRSIQPRDARNEKDRRHRQLARKKILTDVIPADRIPDDSVLPTYVDARRLSGEESMGILIPVDELEAFGEKLVRGVVYVTAKRYVDKTHKVKILQPFRETPLEFTKAMQRVGQVFSCGRGVRAEVAYAPEDPVCGQFRITIWNVLHIYAAIEQVS